MTRSKLKGFTLRLYRWTSHYLSPSLVAVLGVLVITCIALFTPPYIGMADNGDYFRILYGNGLYFNTPDYDSQYFGYFIKQFGIFQYYNENPMDVFTSQSLFIQLAIGLNKLFYSQEVFDVRFMGAVYTALYMGAVYLFVESLTWRIPHKRGYLIAFLAIILFGDTGYTAYFNSFFGESVVFIMLLYMLSAGLLLYRKRYNDYVLLGLFIMSGLLLTTSKQQNATVGVIAGITCFVLLFIRKEKKFRMVTVSLLLVLFAAGVGTYVLIPKEFVNINQYHAMTRGILMESKDPEEALEFFNMNKQYAILDKSIYYELNTTIDVDSKLLEDHFYSKYGFVSILGYYLTHPNQAGKMLDLAAKSAFIIRPPAMGNYEITEGKPFGAQTIFFSGYSILKAALTPRTYGFIVIWASIIIGLYAPSFVDAMRRKEWRLLFRLPLLITMMLFGISGILVSIIGAGDADLAKHVFLFTATFDLVSFVCIADIIRRRLFRSDQVPKDYSTSGNEGTDEVMRS